MKKLLLLLFVAACATFASCDKDDDDKKFEGNAGAFVGTTWESIEIYTEEGTDYKDVTTIKFEKDGKCNISYAEYEKVNGKYEQIQGEGTETVSGTYSVKGNKLTITAVDLESGVSSSLETTIKGKEFSYTEKDEGGTIMLTFKLK